MRAQKELYCIGTGPGDPELLTLKAVRLLKNAQRIAVAGRDPQESLAYRIAVQAVPELAEKELIGLDLPMVRDREILEEKRRHAAEALAELADAGERIAVLTLGDPSIYCSISYLQPYLAERGIAIRYVSGVPSFCAAAAALGTPLALEGEEIRILPGLYEEEIPEFEGTLVFMKSGRNYPELRDALLAGERELFLAESCGLPGEKLVSPPEVLPEEAGYLSILLAKKCRSSGAS